jgi:hypothetical protein
MTTLVDANVLLDIITDDEPPAPRVWCQQADRPDLLAQIPPGCIQCDLCPIPPGCI